MSYLIPSLYPIINLEDQEDPLGYIRRLFDAGVQVIQLRDKASRARLLEVTSGAVSIVRQLEGQDQQVRMVIVNDDAEICKLTNADGVHVGQDDLSPIKAREVIGPDKILGLSASNVQHIASAPVSIIDYFGFGPVFPSPSKVGPIRETGLELLSQACRSSSLPVVAIGGITLELAPEVYAAGAASISVISALAQAEDLGVAVKCFNHAFAVNQSTRKN